jgi:hypothetical protein
MSTRRIFSPAIEKHSFDPGANLVIGRHGSKFVLVTREKWRRHYGQLGPGLNISISQIG